MHLESCLPRKLKTITRNIRPTLWPSLYLFYHLLWPQGFTLWASTRQPTYEDQLNWELSPVPGGRPSQMEGTLRSAYLRANKRKQRGGWSIWWWMMADHYGCWSRQHVTTDCFQRLQPCFFSGTTLDASILDFIALCSPVTGAERLPGAPKRAHPRHIVPSLQPSEWQRNLFVYKNRSIRNLLRGLENTTTQKSPSSTRPTS